MRCGGHVDSNSSSSRPQHSPFVVVQTCCSVHLAQPRSVGTGHTHSKPSTRGGCSGLIATLVAVLSAAGAQICDRQFGKQQRLRALGVASRAAAVALHSDIDPV